MGGFLGALGNVGSTIGQGALKVGKGLGQYLEGKYLGIGPQGNRNQQNLLRSIVGQYRPTYPGGQPWPTYPGTPPGTPSQPPITGPGVSPPGANIQFSPTASPPTGSSVYPQDPRQLIPRGPADQTAPDNPGNVPGGNVPNAAEGKLVTQPTLARLGESGPEMVVPLKARSQNRVQPDLVEGQVNTPRLPGMRLGHYRSFINRGY